MRRWFEIYCDNSNSNWRYNFEESGKSRFWLGMPTKSQLVAWQNFSQVLYAKLAIANPGSNAPADCACGGAGTGPFIPNPDQDYQVVQDWIRYDVLTFFTPIYPVSNLFLTNATNLKPTQDSVISTGQGWFIDKRRKPGDRWQPK